MTQTTPPPDAYRTRTLPETLVDAGASLPERSSDKQRSVKQRFTGVTLLWILLALSLALNGLALYGLGAMYRGLQDAQGQVQEMVSTLRAELQTLGGRPLELQIAIDQEVPISDTVKISDTFRVPLNTVFPFSTQVNTSFNIPLLGRQEISIPVSGSVPVSTTFEIPVQADFPISMTYRLVLDMPVAVTFPPELLEPLDQMLQQAEDGLR
ncbi:MAG: hypothetical protein JW892_08465 [Anaerolineae bacterium]|nr:hypothetical protein [Anaerolineae bacterium]